MEQNVRRQAILPVTAAKFDYDFIVSYFNSEPVPDYIEDAEKVVLQKLRCVQIVSQCS